MDEIQKLDVQLYFLRRKQLETEEKNNKKYNYSMVGAAVSFLLAILAIFTNSSASTFLFLLGYGGIMGIFYPLFLYSCAIFLERTIEKLNKKRIKLFNKQKQIEQAHSIINSQIAKDINS